MARTTANCIQCGIKLETSTMFPVKVANRGKEKQGYICSYCKTHNEGYQSCRTTEDCGKVENGFKYGIELETTGSTDFARAMLFRFGFIATHDCSLNHSRSSNANSYQAYGSNEKSCEYVSGLNHGLKRFTKQFIEIEKAFYDRQLFHDSSCSTHAHISLNDMKDESGNSFMGIIRRNRKYLFRPLENVMKANEQKTIAFFGRWFSNHYAKQLDASYSWEDRYCFINLTPSNNIEFRINNFVSAEQYLELLKFESEVVKIVVNDFCKKYNTSSDTNQLAQKAGAKIAKRLQKRFDGMTL